MGTGIPFGVMEMFCNHVEVVAAQPCECSKRLWIAHFQKLNLCFVSFISICKNSCLNREAGLPGGAVVESLPANAGDTGSSPGLGRSRVPRSN